MKLLGEGVDKLARFIESTRRVRGLSLAHNALGPLGAQVRALFGEVGGVRGCGEGGCSLVVCVCRGGCILVSSESWQMFELQCTVLEARVWTAGTVPQVRRRGVHWLSLTLERLMIVGGLVRGCTSWHGSLSTQV